MQSFDTKSDDFAHDERNDQSIIIGRLEDLPEGSCKTIELPEGNQLAVFNIDGEFHAISNICPHRGAPLAEGILCGKILECGLHGWQFDVRTGECLTVRERIESYRVVVDGGLIKVLF